MYERLRLYCVQKKNLKRQASLCLGWLQFTILINIASLEEKKIAFSNLSRAQMYRLLDYDACLPNNAPLLNSIGK